VISTVPREGHRRNEDRGSGRLTTTKVGNAGVVMHPFHWMNPNRGAGNLSVDRKVYCIKNGII
jgi:hypothetical protein